VKIWAEDVVYYHRDNGRPVDNYFFIKVKRVDEWVDWSRVIRTNLGTEICTHSQINIFATEFHIIVQNKKNVWFGLK
jgi:hypothetical protein